MNGNESTLNANSYISISLLITIVCAALWINNSIALLTYRITKMEERQSRPDPWTGTDQFRWSVELKDSNPHLIIPKPEHRIQQ